MKTLKVIAVLLSLASFASAGVTTNPPSGGITGLTCTATSCTFTAPILQAAASSCADIPYSFTGDTDTGMCQAAASQLQFYIDGNMVAAVRATGFQVYTDDLRLGSTSTHDTIQIQAPAMGGSGSQNGILTSDELNAARTWTLPNRSGEVLVMDASEVVTVANGGTDGTPVPTNLNVYNFCSGGACGDTATDYERLNIGWQADVAYIRTQSLGGGDSSALAIHAPAGIYFGNGSNLWLIDSGQITPAADDAYDVGQFNLRPKTIRATRSIEGSKSLAFADATATSFVRLSVADDDYEGCGFVWTAYAEDADTDARQTRTGRSHVAILNNSATEAAAFSTGDSAVLVTAGTLTCTFDAVSTVDASIDLRATCDTSLDAAAETKTFEWRLDCPSYTAVTPL